MKDLLANLPQYQEQRDKVRINLDVLRRLLIWNRDSSSRCT